MASDADVLKEFLVSLGFRIDETTFRRFNAHIAKAILPVAKLGAEVAGTTAAIETMVMRVAGGMSHLYWLSQRSGSSVKSLQAIGFAFSQIGLNAEGARQMIDNMAGILRTQPYMRGLLANLGVSQKGGAEGTFESLVQRLMAMGKPGSRGYMLATRYASMFGIDEKTLAQIENNPKDFFAALADMRKREAASGTGGQDQAKAFKDFDIEVRKLDSDLGLAAQRIAADFLPAARKIIEWVDWSVQKFNEMDKATGGAVGIGGTLATGAGSVYAGKKIASKLLGLGKGAAKAAADSAETVAKDAAEAAPDAAAGAGALLRWLGPIGVFTGTLFHSSPTNLGEEAYIRAHPEIYPYASGLGEGAPLGIRSNNPLNLRPGGHEAIFGNAGEGIAQGARQILLYARRGWDTIESIISHWAPSLGGNDVAAYIRDVSHRTGFAAAQRLDLSDPEILLRLVRAMIRHENGMEPYASSLERAAVNAALGLPSATLGGGAARNVTVNNKTDIHLLPGSGDRDTARAIGDEQRRVYADWLRDTAGAVQ